MRAQDNSSCKLFYIISKEFTWLVISFHVIILEVSNSQKQLELIVAMSQKDKL
jgi:hypothetical protein